jgi:DNA-binding response OmpR family regulator
MLTSRADAKDKEEGFLKGADDFLTKPFDLQELELRVRAILKRQRVLTSTEEQQILTFNDGQLIIDPVRREVKVNDQLVLLTYLEFALLQCLASKPGRVWSRLELIENVWEDKECYSGDYRVVDVHIGQIRKKLEPDIANPIYVHTIRGVGYKFDPPC